LIEQYRGAIDMLHVAARRKNCAWDPPFREQRFAALLPHLGVLRNLSRILALQARLQIADGQFLDASRTLQTGYSMAIDVQRDGVLIQALVAANIARAMNTVLREWISAPGAPNLYWPLTDLPQPLVDLSSSMQRERALLCESYPALKNPLTITAAQFQPIIDEIRQLGENDQPEKYVQTLSDAIDKIQVLPRANAFLVEQGMPRAQVDALVPADAAARYFAAQFVWSMDELIKWYGLSYWQAVEGLDATAHELEERTAQDRNPLMMLVPATSRAYASTATTEREIAMLQLIEAIRAFAAGNQGKLPGSLQELESLPVRIDPMTGEAFQYQIDGADQFVLEGIADQQRFPGIRYEIKLAR
jgi:hypothetical protein